MNCPGVAVSPNPSCQEGAARAGRPGERGTWAFRGRAGRCPAQCPTQQMLLKGGPAMMQGPWLGIVLMVGMVVGLAWWCWWAMRKDKDKDKEEKN